MWPSSAVKCGLSAAQHIQALISDCSSSTQAQRLLRLYQAHGRPFVEFYYSDVFWIEPRWRVMQHQGAVQQQTGWEGSKNNFNIIMKKTTFDK